MISYHVHLKYNICATSEYWLVTLSFVIVLNKYCENEIEDNCFDLKKENKYEKSNSIGKK